MEIPDLKELDENVSLLMSDSITPEEEVELQAESAEEAPAEVEEGPTELEVMRAGFIRDLQEKRAENRELRDQLQHFQTVVLRDLAALRKPQVEEVIPDKEENPREYLEHVITKTARETQERLDRIEQGREADAVKQETDGAVSAVVTAEQEFVKEHPDYYDRLNHVRMAQLKILAGQGASPEEAWSRILSAEGELAGRALKRGVNPASIVFDVSERLGFGQQEAAEAPARPSGNGKISQVSKGVQSTKSLSTAAGKAQSNVITMEEFLELDKGSQTKIMANPELWERLVSKGELPRSFMSS